MRILPPQQRLGKALCYFYTNEASNVLCIVKKMSTTAILNYAQFTGRRHYFISNTVSIKHPYLQENRLIHPMPLLLHLRHLQDSHHIYRVLLQLLDKQLLLSTKDQRRAAYVN